MTVRNEYQIRFDQVLSKLAPSIEAHLRDHLAGEPRIDRIQARPKSVDRFAAKAEKLDDGLPKYRDPLHQIQDQVGARIITFYLSDVDRISKIIERYFRPVEARNLIPESEWEFGYFGRHYVLLIPAELVDQDWDPDLVPEFFELQVKTLFQHAWSEAEHDLGYKPHLGGLPPGAKRKLALASAQAWGADQIFDELFVSTH